MIATLWVETRDCVYRPIRVRFGDEDDFDQHDADNFVGLQPLLQDWLDRNFPGDQLLLNDWSVGIGAEERATHYNDVVMAK